MTGLLTSGHNKIPKIKLPAQNSYMGGGMAKPMRSFLG